MYSHLLFDLDGTLTDSGLGITKAVQYALGQMGYEVPPRESLLLSGSLSSLPDSLGNCCSFVSVQLQ